MSSTAIATRPDPSVSAVESRGFLIVESFDQAIKVADYINKSALVPDSYRGKPADIVIAMQYGMELGFSPLQALWSVAVVNGRPTVWGDALPALVMSWGGDMIDEEPQGDDPEKWVAVCTVTRPGKEPKRKSFSWKQAKRAGLANKKGTWQDYPEVMLLWRARGFAVRAAYPDKLKGLILAEEASDYSDATQEPSEPRRVGSSSTTPASTPAASSPTEVASASTSPTQTAMEAGARSSAPVPSKPQPASVAPAEQVERPVKILNTSAVQTASGNLLYEITTTRGVFYTQSEDLYKGVATCEGTDTEMAISYKMARKDADRVRVITKLGLHEETPATAAPTDSAADGGEAMLS